MAHNLERLVSSTSFMEKRTSRKSVVSTLRTLAVVNDRRGSGRPSSSNIRARATPSSSGRAHVLVVGHPDVLEWEKVNIRRYRPVSGSRGQQENCRP
jgi:hypothetical protein